MSMTIRETNPPNTEAINLPFNFSSIKSEFVFHNSSTDTDSSEGKWVIIQGNSVVLEQAHSGLTFPSGKLPDWLTPQQTPLCIGIWREKPLRAITISGTLQLQPPFAAATFNAADEKMDIQTLTLAGLAKQILHWERQSRHCSRCGAETGPIAATRGKLCTSCGTEHFPHIHPCAIVLVKRGNELLLTRKAEWPPGRYSLVAGFLDLGESLEECAIREVREETGIEITNVRYVGSQNWPFPAQLMAGFVADYDGGEIAVDHNELEDARWFSTDALPTLPPSRSIARWIIDKEAFMKRIILICLLILLAIPMWSTAGVIAPARIRLVDGDIMFRTPDAGEWLAASINTPLDEGDAVWCPDGAKVEIQLSDGTVVRLDGGSQLDLLANEEGFSHLHLASGRLYLVTALNSAKNSLQIDADDTTVLPDARTRLRIDMLPNSQEDVAIFKGSAYVEGNGSRTKVRAGEHISLEEGHSEILPLNPPDSWESWNTERDLILSRSVKADSNLPDELRSHSAELNSNGAWIHVPSYGMVWRPAVIVSNDWAPYRSGRWIRRGNDYIWVSFESWGWAPYHYGRWSVISGFGWCWVPPLHGDVHWVPGVSVGNLLIKPQHETRTSIVIKTPPKINPPRIDHLDSRVLRQRFQRITPQSYSQRPYQQPTQITIAPSVQSTQTAPVKDKRVIHPVQWGGQQPRSEPVTRDMKQKKIWQITTPDESKEKNNREKEHMGKEKKSR